MNSPEALARQVMARSDELAAISETPGALTRRYLTDEHRRANELVAGWMTAAGMAAHQDAAGNMVGRYQAARGSGPALLMVHYGRGCRRQVRLGGLLQMESELGVGHEVGVPVAGPRRAGDEQASVQVMKPNLYTAGPPRPLAGGGDVDGLVPFQGPANVGVH